MAAATNVQILRLPQGASLATLENLGARLIVDLVGGVELDEAICLSQEGVIRLWCDGVAESLDFSSIIEPERSHTVSVSIQSGIGEPPVIVREAVLTTLGPLPELDRRNAAARAIALLIRAICEPTIPHHAQRLVNEAVPSVRRSRPHKFTTVMSLLVAAIRRRARSYLWYASPWFLAYRADCKASVVGTTASDGSGLTYMNVGNGRFVADPCVLSHKGIEHVFVEEYSYTARRAVISWCYLQQDGTLSELRPVLEKPYHLSYPFVFESAGTIYMVPESAANRTVDLYVAAEFPLRWELHTTLLREVNAADATLHFDGNEWWMFVCIGEYGSYTWDELFLFSAPQPFGPWRPHRNNPVKSDSRSARPAGRLFYSNGMLIRPTQDCSRYYGEAINFCRITALHADCFQEEIIGRIGPDLIPGTNAIHTISFSERLQVFDAKWQSLRRSPFKK